MSGTIPTLPNTPPWRDVQLKHSDNSTLLLPQSKSVAEVYLSQNRRSKDDGLSTHRVMLPNATTNLLHQTDTTVRKSVTLYSHIVHMLWARSAIHNTIRRCNVKANDIS
jgi:hypothetical protein